MSREKVLLSQEEVPVTIDFYGSVTREDFTTKLSAPCEPEVTEEIELLLQ